MKECPPDASRIVSKVLAYLSGLPNGESGLTGIARNLFQTIPDRKQLTLLTEVLGDLVTQGLIERTGTGNSQGYRLRSRGAGHS